MHNSDYRYAKEKLYLAIRYLATNKEDVRTRLLNVYKNELIKLKESDLPDSMQKDWQEITDSLTNKGPYEIFGNVVENGVTITRKVIVKNSVQNTLDKMYGEKAERIAIQIFDMFLELNHFND